LLLFSYVKSLQPAVKRFVQVLKRFASLMRPQSSSSKQTLFAHKAQEHPPGVLFQCVLFMHAVSVSIQSGSKKIINYSDSAVAAVVGNNGRVGLDTKSITPGTIVIQQQAQC
jgi:hypothetical protein